MDGLRQILEDVFKGISTVKTYVFEDVDYIGTEERRLTVKMAVDLLMLMFELRSPYVFVQRAVGRHVRELMFELKIMDKVIDRIVIERGLDTSNIFHVDANGIRFDIPESDMCNIVVSTLLKPFYGYIAIKEIVNEVPIDRQLLREIYEKGCAELVESGVLDVCKEVMDKRREDNDGFKVVYIEIYDDPYIIEYYYEPTEVSAYIHSLKLERFVSNITASQEGT